MKVNSLAPIQSKEPITSSALITEAEVRAKYIPVSTMTLWRMKKRGLLTPVYPLGTNRKFYRLSDVLRVVEGAD